MSHRVGSVTELYELVSRGEIDKAEAMRLAKQLKTAKRAEPAEPAGQPAGVDRDVLRDRVCDVLADKVRQLLKVSADDLDVDVELSEYGLDSVVISHLVSMVNDALGLDLKPTVVFEHPTLRALVATSPSTTRRVSRTASACVPRLSCRRPRRSRGPVRSRSNGRAPGTRSRSSG